MAQKSEKSLKQDRLKRVLLLVFVFASVFMIGAIWVEGIVEPEPATPSYYRDTFEVDDEAIYLTATADALKYNPEPDGTPSPTDDDDHHGSGQGQGAGQGAGQSNSGGEGADY